MRAVDQIKKAVVRATPDAVAERLFPWRRAVFRSAGVTVVAQASKRLLIAPVNSAGQGYAWARAAERVPGVAASDFMRRAGVPVFVSTPDLLSEAPAAEWLPAQMPRIYGEADIVLDQFSLGSYGVAACEALASGRIVISHVSRTVRDRVCAMTGRELPIIQSRAADLEAVLRHVAADSEAARAVAERGSEFVRAVHSGERSAQVIARFLGETAGNSDPSWETGTMPVARNPKDSVS